MGGVLHRHRQHEQHGEPSTIGRKNARKSSMMPDTNKKR